MKNQADTVISTEGDTLSGIAYRLYGSSREKVEDILELNPQLCRYPARLPAGVPVRLPAKQAAAVPTIKTVQLWD